MLSNSLHIFSNRESYPRYHLWVSANKINVFSNCPIIKGDAIYVENKTYTVSSVDTAEKAKSDEMRYRSDVLFFTVNYE